MSRHWWLRLWMCCLLMSFNFSFQRILRPILWINDHIARELWLGGMGLGPKASGVMVWTGVNGFKSPKGFAMHLKPQLLRRTYKTLHNCLLPTSSLILPSASNASARLASMTMTSPFLPPGLGFCFCPGCPFPDLFTSFSWDGISVASLFEVALTPSYSLCHHPVHFHFNCSIYQLLCSKSPQNLLA